MTYWMVDCSVYLYIVTFGVSVRICRVQGRWPRLPRFRYALCAISQAGFRGNVPVSGPERSGRGQPDLQENHQSRHTGDQDLTGSGLTGGSSLAAEASCRRGEDATGCARCRRSSARLVLAIATSASIGAIMSAAAASARCSTAGRRPGAGNQVTVTDSTIPCCGWRPPRPRAASAPGTAAPAAARALGSHRAGNDLKRLAYPHCAPASARRHRRSTVLRGG